MAKTGKNQSMKMTSPTHKLTAMHPGHKDHLCELVSHRKMAKVARMSKNAKYICYICGRAASKALNLCEAVET